MKDLDSALTEAVANSSVEQTPLQKEEIDIIKKALEMSKTNEKSFFTSLCELIEQIKNEEQRNKSR